MNIKQLNKIIVSLNALSGISKKQAEKIAYQLIMDDGFLIDDLQDSLRGLKEVKRCIECFNISEEDKCYICMDKSRDSKLVIVENPIDINKFEKIESFKPYYHILNGLIRVKDPESVKDLNIKNLEERIVNFKEVILALSPNLEGIVTSNYLLKILSKYDNIKITQLAQGIPLGAALDYVDELTLKSAFDNRKELK